MSLPRHRLSRRAIAGARRQDGQSLVFSAVLLTMLLALVALAIDLGSLYVVQRHAQTAADAGSLAASEDLPLPSNTTAATTDATNYAHTLNDASAAPATIAAPVGGSGCAPASLSYNSTSPSSWAACFQAQVGVAQTVPLTFERLFGNNTGTVSASAVATVNLTASASGGNSVPNGLFPTACNPPLGQTQSNPSFCEPGFPGSVDALIAGSTIGTSGTPWNVWYGNVDWAQSGFAFVNYNGPTNNTAANVIDMNGLEDGGISQTVATVTGKKYLLSFWLSGNASYSESTFTGTVAIGRQLSATPTGEAVPPQVPTAVCPSSTICIPFTHTNSPANQMTWEQVGIPFTATSTSTVISFLSTSSQINAQYANTGPTIAEVGVQPATYSLTQ